MLLVDWPPQHVPHSSLSFKEVTGLFQLLAPEQSAESAANAAVEALLLSDRDADARISTAEFQQLVAKLAELSGLPLEEAAVRLLNGAQQQQQQQEQQQQQQQQQQEQHQQQEQQQQQQEQQQQQQQQKEEQQPEAAVEQLPPAAAEQQQQQPGLQPTHAGQAQQEQHQQQERQQQVQQQQPQQQAQEREQGHAPEPDAQQQEHQHQQHQQQREPPPLPDGVTEQELPAPHAATMGGIPASPSNTAPAAASPAAAAAAAAAGAAAAGEGAGPPAQHAAASAAPPPPPAAPAAERPQAQLAPAAQLAQLFGLWDTAGDGSLGFGELCQGLSKLQRPLKSKQDITSLISEAATVLAVHDADGDGRLNQAEFVQFLRQLMGAAGYELHAVLDDLLLLAQTKGDNAKLQRVLDAAQPQMDRLLAGAEQ